MEKLFFTRLWVVLLSLVCAGVFVSCSGEDGLSEGERLEKGLIGHWYYVVDTRIYTVLFSGNGTGESACHVYSAGEWDEQAMPLQYTLSGHVLAIKPGDGEAWAGVVGIVGDSMSLVDGDLTAMFTRYDGSEGKIDALKKEIVEGLEEMVPDEGENEEWLDENRVQSVVLRIYSSLRDYEYKQMLLEKIRLTQTDFQGRPAAPITPVNEQVADAWEAAYRVINLSNVLINKLEAEGKGMEGYKCRAYANEAKVLRSLVYYNLSQLWGSVPYVTEQKQDDVLHSPVLSPQELCLELDGVLQSVDILLGGECRVTVETVKAIRGEIALALGDKSGAGYTLGDCQSDFSIAIDWQSAPEMHQIFGERLPNYTSGKTALLLQEISLADAEDTSALLDSWKCNKMYWGYWLMLKRTGQARAVCGCEEYELLMPIPQKELDLMPSMTQNPGYD